MSDYPKIDGFVIIKMLGQGGMGQVFKAKQISMDRFVAIKIIKNTKDNEHYIERFHKEAKAVAQLNHPNIVRGFDHGKNDDICYFVMEFIEGKNLSDKINSFGHLPEKEALHIILQISKALKHAHKNNIIHRDIKPDNIMIGNDDRILLCDLGVAKNKANKTTIGVSLMGTPHYMSPEQCKGEKTVDGRSDIYNLGITLYHAITGEVPFDASHAAAVCVMHIHNEIKNPRKILSDISNNSVQLIKKMVAKNPDDRFQTAEELIIAITNIQNGKNLPLPIIARKISPRKINSRRGVSSTSRTRATKTRDVQSRDVQRQTKQHKHQPIKRKIMDKKIKIFIGVFIAILLSTFFISQQISDTENQKAKNEIFSLIKEKKWEDALYLISEYNLDFSDPRIENMEHKISEFLNKKKYILSIAITQKKKCKEELLALKQSLDSYTFTTSINTLEKQIQELHNFMEKIHILFQNKNITNLQELLRKIPKAFSKQFPNSHAIKNDIQNKLNSLKNEQKNIAQKILKDVPKKDTLPKDKIRLPKNDIEPEEKKIDPNLKSLLKKLEKVISFISDQKIEKAIEILKTQSTTILQFKSNKKIKEYMIRIEDSFIERISFLLEYEEDSVSERNLINASSAIDIYLSLPSFLKKNNKLKDALISINDLIFQITKYALDNLNRRHELYITTLNFSQKYNYILKNIIPNWNDTIINIYSELKRYQLSRNQIQEILPVFQEIFAKRFPRMQSEIDNIKIEVYKNLEEVLQEEITRLFNALNYDEVENLSDEIINTFPKSLHSFYNAQKNHASVRKLIVVNNNRARFRYAFNSNSEGLADWTLVSTKTKRKLNIRRQIDQRGYLAINPKQTLFWNFPVTNRFTIELRLWNPNHRNVRRNRNFQWARSFGIIDFKSSSSALLFLFNKNEIVLVKKGKNPSKGTNIIFPKNQNNPQSLQFIIHADPPKAEINNSPISMQIESIQDFPQGRHYIGIINNDTRQPIIINNILIRDVDFYTEEYMEKSELNIKK